MRSSILVIGANSEVGQATCHALAASQYDLFLISRDGTKLSSLKTEIQSKSNVNVNVLSLDYASDSSMTELKSLNKPLSSYSGVVVLPPRPIISSSIFPGSTEWEELFKISFIGPLEIIKSFLPNLTNDAKIVIASGFSNKQIHIKHAAYSVLRMMWLAEAKCLSHQLGESGIHVNTLSFGGILTNRFSKVLAGRAEGHSRTIEEQLDIEVANVPLKKYASLQEITSIVKFFLSKESNHITGANVTVDGGFTTAY